MNLCRHSWSFPRRWPTFGEQRNVDVQTCAKCGARRISPVQFGPWNDGAHVQPEITKPAEVRS